MKSHLTESLHNAIHEIVRELDNTKPYALNPTKRKHLVNDLETFVLKAAHKFIKRQLEHGGNIEERDLDHEIDQEIFDLFHYQQARKRKK